MLKVGDWWSGNGYSLEQNRRAEIAVKSHLFEDVGRKKGSGAIVVFACSVKRRRGRFGKRVKNGYICILKNRNA